MEFILPRTTSHVTIIEIKKWHDDETDTAFVRNRDPGIQYYKKGLLMAAAQHDKNKFGRRLERVLRGAKD